MGIHGPLMAVEICRFRHLQGHLLRICSLFMIHSYSSSNIAFENSFKTLEFKWIQYFFSESFSIFIACSQGWTCEVLRLSGSVTERQYSGFFTGVSQEFFKGVCFQLSEDFGAWSCDVSGISCVSSESFARAIVISCWGENANVKCKLESPGGFTVI